MKNTLLTLFAAFILVASSYAAVTVTQNGDETQFDSIANTLISTGTQSDFTFGDSAASSFAQTFTVGSSALDVTAFSLIHENDINQSADLTMHIFEVSDTSAATISLPGTPLLTESFTVPGVTPDDDTLLTLTLDSTLTLSANTGYAFFLDVSDTSASDEWRWVRTAPAGNTYAGGVFYEDGDPKESGERDGSLAVIGTVVPEPSSASLLVLGTGLAYLARRKRTRR